MDNQFQQICTELEEKGVEPQKYFLYLKNTLRPEFGKTVELLNEEDSQEISQVKKIGFRLLTENKVSVSDLNKILKNLNKIDSKELLQELLIRKKIKPKEFIELELENWEGENSENLYQVKIQSGRPEFALKQKKGNQKVYGVYQVIEEVARGGMGIVYKAYHPQLKRIFALKLLLEGRDAADYEMKRFHREIQATAKLKHPNIIRVVDSGRKGGEHYFVMEFIEGKTLDDWIQTRPPLRKGLTVIQKSLEALHYAHTQGVIHRDIKPENILITKSGEPKLTDFGLAKDKTLDNESQKLTHSSAVFGTPAYMSPEQVCGEVAKLDALSDIYSMGITLYELLTGGLPFQASAEHHLFQKILSEEPLPPSVMNPEVHPDIDLIVLKAIEKQRFKRYTSANAFAKDLELFLQGYPITAKPANKFEKFEKWSKRNRDPLIVVGLLFFLISFIFYVFTLQKKSQAERDNFLHQEKQRRHQEQEQRFKNAFGNAKREIKKAKRTAKENIGAKIRHLLKALSHLNTALSVKPKFRELEETKSKVGQQLITLACASKNYQLAQLVATELQTLSILEEKKSAFINQVQSEKSKLLKQHKDRFHYWIQKLEIKRQPKPIRESAAREISKMQEKEILAQLLQIVDESTTYFLGNEGRSVKKNEFYETMVTALGWSTNPKIGEPILNALSKLAEKISEYPEGSKPIAETNYMITLAKALANSKVPNIALKLKEIRWKMGKGELFWNNTITIYTELAALDQLANKTPTDAEGFFERGHIHYDEGELSQALEDFNETIKLDKTFGPAYNARGIVKLAQGNPQGAIQDFTAAIEINPNDYNAFNQRGQARMSQEKTPEALRDYIKALKINPKFASAHFGLGQVYGKMGDLDSAVRSLTQAIRLNPQSAQYYFARAKMKYSKGELNGAIEDYNKGIQLNLQDDEAFLNRGLVKVVKKDFSGAITDFNNAIRLNPQNEKAYCNRGIAKYNAGDTKGAIEDCTEAIRLDQRFAEAYQYRGLIQQKLKLYNEALIDLNQARILKSTLSPQLKPQLARVHLERAIQKFDMKVFFKVIEDCNAAIQLDSKLPTAFYLRGLARYSLKEIEEAIADFELALKMEIPENLTLKIKTSLIAAYHQQGVSFLKKENYPATIKIFSKILLLDAHNVEAHYYRGTARTKKEDFEGAKDDFLFFMKQTKNTKNEQNHKRRKEILYLFPGLE